MGKIIEVIMKNYIEFKNVSFGYDDEYSTDVERETVIDNLSVSIAKGDFVCVLGHNGCGKSIHLLVAQRS